MASISDYKVTLIRVRRGLLLTLGLLLIFTTRALPNHEYQTELFGKKYVLSEKKGLQDYIKALDREIARSKREEPQGEGHKKDPLNYKEPKNYVDKKLRKAMEETRAVAVELSSQLGRADSRSLNALYIMAGAIRGSFMRVLPP